MENLQRLKDNLLAVCNDPSPRLKKGTFWGEIHIPSSDDGMREERSISGTIERTVFRISDGRECPLNIPAQEGFFEGSLEEARELMLEWSLPGAIRRIKYHIRYYPHDRLEEYEALLGWFEEAPETLREDIKKSSDRGVLLQEQLKLQKELDERAHKERVVSARTTIQRLNAEIKVLWEDLQSEWIYRLPSPKVPEEDLFKALEKVQEIHGDLLKEKAVKEEAVKEEARQKALLESTLGKSSPSKEKIALVGENEEISTADAASLLASFFNKKGR